MSVDITGRNRELGHAIPQDDGTELACWQFEFPDTFEWEFAIRTLIYSLGTGRYWKREVDGRRIEDVQPTGENIFDSLVRCDGETPETEETTIEIIKIIKQNEECEMSCCKCDTQGQITTNTPSTDTTVFPEVVPNEIEQPATTIPTDSGFKNFQCQWAQFILDQFSFAISEAGDLVEIGQMNTAETERIVFERFGQASLYSRAIERMWLITVHFVRWASPAVIATMLSILSAKRGQLVDAIYCSDDAQEQSDKWYDILVDEQANIMYKVLFYIWLLMVDFTAFWADSVTRMAFRDYARAADYPTDCTCGSDGGDAGLPAGYVLVPMIINTVVNINGASQTSFGDLMEVMTQGNGFVDLTYHNPVYNLAVVPNANRVGFFYVLESASVPNGNSVSQRLANGSTQFTLVNFGGGVNTFLPEEIFAGAVSSDATMQTWLADNTYRWEDPATVTNDGKIVASWGINGGATGSGDINEFVVRGNWIINTAGL